MRCVLLSLLAFVLVNGTSLAESRAKTYGKAPTIVKPTAISVLKAEPAKYKDQSVLVTGTIVDVCRHAGCWVEVQASDSTRIICKSLNETVLFPEDVVGKLIQLQGKVVYDAKAPGAVTEQHEGGEVHACPAPQVLVSIEGATVTEAVILPAEPVKE